MPHLHSAFLRPSCLALSVVSALPGVAFAATDDMTVIATGNARSAFEAPMMVSVIDTVARKIRPPARPPTCCATSQA